MKRLHFRAVGYWWLKPHTLLNIDDVGGDITEGSVLHFGVLLGPLFVHIRSLVVEEGLHRGFLTVVGVQALDLALSGGRLPADQHAPICGHSCLECQVLLGCKGACALEMALARGNRLEIDVFIVRC